MFKFSLNWLRDYCGENVEYDEIMRKLEIQGFEFEGKQKINGDIVTAIEVKANRPDMLSHIGIAREIKAFDGEKIPKLAHEKFEIDNKKFPIKIKVDDSICKRFCAIKISGVDVSKPTPKYISERLQSLGINCVNVVVDIGNYFMLDLGQPLHAYDFDKLAEKNLRVHKAEKDDEITTFSGKFSKIKKDDVVISDAKGIKCIAGIIGTNDAAVTEKTENIVLEAAVFDEVSVRLTSRRLKISTPSSFRFERGVNINATFDILVKCAKMIIEVCGGKIEVPAFDYYPCKFSENCLNLNINNVNKLLGTHIDREDIEKYLKKYDFNCVIDNPNDKNFIKVLAPDYRLDVKSEVDLIEEIARIHGYDNIEPVMPTIAIDYNENKIWSNMAIIRDILIGFGFNETINYSFIPNNTMNIFEIKKGEKLFSDLTLQNPIANAYSLMRPTLAYSLLSCLAYNYSISNSDLSLFEIGRAYFKDEKFDTGVQEIDTCGFIMSGVRIPRGFGVDKDIKYTYYDSLSYLKAVMDRFGQSFELRQNDYKFCEENSCYDIILDGETIGFIGELNKSKLSKIQNVKLIKDKIFYCEFYLKYLTEKPKKIRFESKYPPVKRLYNLIQKRSITAKEITDTIKSASGIVTSVTASDIYFDKNFADDEYAVLYEVNYCSTDSTLTAEEIETTEKIFLQKLNEKFGINLKN